jgi:hypothetical protein
MRRRVDFPLPPSPCDRDHLSRADLEGEIPQDGMRMIVSEPYPVEPDHGRVRERDRDRFRRREGFPVLASRFDRCRAAFHWTVEGGKTPGSRRRVIPSVRIENG